MGSRTTIQAEPPPYRLASRRDRSQTTVVIGDGQNMVRIGDGKPIIMAGPCSVEGREQIVSVARMVKEAGAKILRGGAFKPRTSPYQFQGLGEEGLLYLAEARQVTGLPAVTEVMEPGLVEKVARYVDILQIGSRNMQNYPLLIAAGQNTYGRPIMLKRGLAATIEEWLLAAEYILLTGNSNVILCERGIRSFDRHTRNLLDLTCIPLLKEITHLPIVVDPSHATGRRELVLAMSRASIAAGADGLLIEIHPEPENALSDGMQSIYPETLSEICRDAFAIRTLLQNKEISR